MKTKKGVTLVELICTLAIAAVIGVVVVAVIPMISKGYVSASSVAKAKSATTTIQKLLESELRMATEAELTDEQSTDDYDYVLYSTGGKIEYYKKGSGIGDFVPEDGVYNSMYYTISFTSTGTYVDVTLTAFTEKDGDTLYTNTFTIKPLNCDVQNETGTDTQNNLRYSVT